MPTEVINSYDVIQKAAAELGWPVDTQILVLAGYLATDIDLNTFTDATVEYAAKTGLSQEMMVKAFSYMADAEQATREKSFSTYIEEILEEARRTGVTQVNSDTIIVDLADVIEPAKTISYELSKEWTDKVRNYFKIGGPIPGEALGRVIDRQTYKGNSDYEVCIDIVNTRNGAVVDAYMLFKGRSVCGVAPMPALKPGLLRFDHNDEHVEVKVPE